MNDNGYIYNDGGREAAGFKGSTGDCVARSIAIVTGRPYREVYDRLAAGNATQRRSKRTGKQTRTARNGIYTRRKWFKDYMAELGFEWVPTMGIGTGCHVHLVADELPPGRLIASVSKHYTAVLNGVINDTHDPRRETIHMIGNKRTHVSRRCVYGYWILT